jgi:hypothetical protein
MLKETDLFEPVKNWFLENGYEVYAEVTAPMLIGRPDVVARKHPVTICVELKKSISFELLYQALERKRYFNYVYIGIPKRKSIIPYLAQDILRRDETHYCNPKPSLSKALLEIEHEWCESKKENRKLHFRFKGYL